LLQPLIVATRIISFFLIFQITFMKVGPIPIDDGVGKEVITRMTTNMATNKEFYTDSNDKDILK